jgi:hypothetical protein
MAESKFYQVLTSTHPNEIYKISCYAYGTESNVRLAYSCDGTRKVRLGALTVISPSGIPTQEYSTTLYQLGSYWVRNIFVQTNNPQTAADAYILYQAKSKKGSWIENYEAEPSRNRNVNITYIDDKVASQKHAEDKKTNQSIKALEGQIAALQIQIAALKREFEPRHNFQAEDLGYPLTSTEPDRPICPNCNKEVLGTAHTKEGSMGDYFICHKD